MFDENTFDDVAAPPERVTGGEGTNYSLLTGSSLASILMGHCIKWTRCYATHRCTDCFSSEGDRFVKTGDRVPFLHGIYELGHDRYKLMLLGSITLKAMYVSEDERLAESRLLNGRWTEPVPASRFPYQQIGAG